MAIKKKKKPVNKITELLQKVKSLESEVLKNNETIASDIELFEKIKLSLNLSRYDHHEEIFERLGELKTKKDASVAALKDLECSIDRTIESLRKENSRLWYMVRVSVKDPTIENDVIKPGEEYDHNRNQLRRSF